METLNNKSCEFEDKVIDYCEGILSGGDAKETEAHLETCERCLAVCREHKELCDALSACNTDVPAELHADIMRAVRRESMRMKLMRAVKRYAAPVAAALVLMVALPVMLKNGTDVPNADSPLMYSVTDNALDAAIAADGKGRLGAPTGELVVKEDACDAATEPAPGIAEAPADEAVGDYEVYQHVVENGEVVTCYNCPVVEVDANKLKKLAQDYAELIVVSEDGGILFETDKNLLKALKKAGCDISDIGNADFVRVNVK